MLSGFRQFIMRGNVVDLAVGVVIGGAFGADGFDLSVPSTFDTRLVSR